MVDLKIGDVVAEIITITAGHADPSAHGNLARSHLRGDYTAAQSRVKLVCESIASTTDSGMSYRDRLRLGYLWQWVDRHATGAAQDDWVEPN